jgi:hypothetical protein
VTDTPTRILFQGAGLEQYIHTTAW